MPALTHSATTEKNNVFIRNSNLFLGPQLGSELRVHRFRAAADCHLGNSILRWEFAEEGICSGQVMGNGAFGPFDLDNGLTGISLDLLARVEHPICRPNKRLGQIN